MNRRLLPLLTTLAALTALAQIPASAGAPSLTAGPPLDYHKVKGLSQPVYKTIREVYEIPMEDGINIYAEVVRPKAPGRFATILELSPYHGPNGDRSGTRILPGPRDKQGNQIGLAGYFPPRGYAVVFVDLRGTGRSEGCLDQMGPKDQSDAYEIVEWAAKQKWSNGRVGMTGHSYVGSTPMIASSQNPPHLVTIVPSAGIAAFYHHEFQQGVPYFLQWGGAGFAYQTLAMNRHLPPQLGETPVLGYENGDNFGNDMEYFGCGWPQSAFVTGHAYVTGEETAYHEERDFRKAATKSDVPVFMVHGVHDNAVRTPALDWYNARNGRPGDKTWIGQWDHGSGTAPNTRTCSAASSAPCNDQWTVALHAWFDKHLQGRDVETGPPVEVFLNDRSVFTAPSWPPKADKLTLYPQADNSIATKPGDAGSLSYVADPRGFLNEFQTGSVVFETAPLKEDLLVVGAPEMKLAASVTSPQVHINASLYEVVGGEPQRIGRIGWAVNPYVGQGIDKPQPVIPGQVMQMNLDKPVQAHLLRKGSVLRLVVASSHPDKVPYFAAGSQVTVVVGGKEGTRFTLPVIDNPILYNDVLRRPNF